MAAGGHGVHGIDGVGCCAHGELAAGVVAVGRQRRAGSTRAGRQEPRSAQRCRRRRRLRRDTVRGEAVEERREVAGWVEVRSWAGELVDDQSIHQGQEVVDITRRLRGSELAEQWHHPAGDLVLQVGDLEAKGGLVRRFDEMVRRAWLSTRPLPVSSSTSRPIALATAATVGVRMSTASLIHIAVSRSRMRRSTPTRSESRVRKRFEVNPIGSPAVASTARWVSCRMPGVPSTSIAASSSRPSRSSTTRRCAGVRSGLQQPGPAVSTSAR